MKHKKTKNIVMSFFVFFLLALFFILFSFTFITVKSASVLKLDKKIEELNMAKEKYKKLEKKYSEWMNIQTKYAEVKNGYFTSLQKLTQFNNELNRILNSSTDRVLKKEFSNNDIKNEFLQMSISIIFESSYKKIKEFIFKINQKKKMIIFKKIEITKKSNTCYCEMILEVYFVR